MLLDGTLTGPAFVSQLSTHDLFVETDRPLGVGIRVRLQVYVPGRAPFDVAGVVSRHGETATLRGMRVDFVDISPEAIAAIGEHLAPLRKPFQDASPTGGAPPDPTGWDDPPVGPIGFVETVDPEASPLHRPLHLEDEAAVVQSLAASGVILPAGASSALEFETADPGLFDPENAEPKDLAPFAPPADAARPAPSSAAPAAASFAPPPPSSEPERRAYSRSLGERGKDAFARGLVLRAASDIALAVAFDPEDSELRLLHERTKSAADTARAEDLYRQGVNLAALGDHAAAAELLVTACALSGGNRRLVVAAVRTLLQSETTRAARRAGSLLRGAIANLPDDADLHVLYGSSAEVDGAEKVAQRAYRRALEIEPHHAAARALLARPR